MRFSAFRLKQGFLAARNIKLHQRIINNEIETIVNELTELLPPMFWSCFINNPVHFNLHISHHEQEDGLPRNPTHHRARNLLVEVKTKKEQMIRGKMD